MGDTYGFFELTYVLCGENESRGKSMEGCSMKTYILGIVFRDVVFKDFILIHIEIPLCPHGTRYVPCGHTCFTFTSIHNFF